MKKSIVIIFVFLLSSLCLDQVAKIHVKTIDADICFYEYFFNKEQLENVHGYTHNLR